ncbi:MAG: TetR/AcrR family transcriptional regulator, partial [Pseudomonadota bacterium]
SAVIERFYDRYADVVNRRHPIETPWAERERARLREVIAFLYSDPLASVMFGVLSASPRAAEVEAQRHADMVALSGRNIRDGVERGAIPPNANPDLAGAAILGAVRSAFTFAVRTDVRPSTEELAEQLWAVIAGALKLDQHPLLTLEGPA